MIPNEGVGEQAYTADFRAPRLAIAAAEVFEERLNRR